MLDVSKHGYSKCQAKKVLTNGTLTNPIVTTGLVRNCIVRTVFVTNLLYSAFCYKPPLWPDALGKMRKV